MCAPSKRMNKNTERRTESGFSLVELAIALTVIGLLLAGLTKGTELINNARADRVVTDLTEISMAMEAFKRTYGGLPGDLRYVNDRLPNCENAPCNGNGNGDWLIGSDSPFSNVSYPATSEMRAFWVQLAKTGYLTTVNTDYTGTNNVPGVAFPKTPFGGGYRVFANSVTGSFPHIQTNVIRPSRETGTGTLTELFTAPIAGRIDRKIDDGNPSTGTVRGLTTSGACNSGANGLYPEAIKGRRCNLLYVLGR